MSDKFTLWVNKVINIEVCLFTLEDSLKIYTITFPRISILKVKSSKDLKSKKKNFKKIIREQKENYVGL